MTREQKQYMDSFKYEALMKRAYRSDRNFSKGIDNSVFRLLEHIENGHYSKSSDYPKQVEKIKGYLSTAIAKIRLWKLTAQELNTISHFSDLMRSARDGDDLAEIIEGILDATQRFKVY